MKRIELSKLLDEIPDPRRGNRTRHNLKDILLIGIMSMICNADGFTGMEIWGQTHEKTLREVLELPYGIPSHDTFGDVFSALSAEKLAECFGKWIAMLRKDLDEAQLVSIDGKTIRRSKGTAQKATHVVTAFASEMQLVLGQLSTDEKSNEITTIPELLKMFGVKGRIITIDAMGTQTDIAQAIVEKEGNYVLALKNNHPNLLEDVSYFLENEVMTQKKSILKETGQYFRTIEKGHGRIETRECFICNDVSWLEQRDKWLGLSGIGVIASQRETPDGVITTQNHYFLYSMRNATAESIMKIKRSHWGIENQLHWMLDMTFREDECRARMMNAAENLNILRKLALQLMNQETSIKGSMKSKRQRCGWDIFYAFKVLGVPVS